MNNIVKPVACKIREVRRESLHEYTFRVETDIRPSHGQFLQLSIPKVGEAPISVSSFGDGWMDFTIRSVGKVTDEIFEKQPGDILFLRGAYGKGWPVVSGQTHGGHYRRHRACAGKEHAEHVLGAGGFCEERAPDQRI